MTLPPNVANKSKRPHFDGKKILITGGTGSLGKTLVRRFLDGSGGSPAKIFVLSRDEAKQHSMRMEYNQQVAATDEITYRNFQEMLEFRIGDVRDIHSVTQALRDVDIVFNTAALKQVLACEYFPYEAVRTNVEGPENIVRAIQEHNLPVETVVGISTDKACKPVSVMGMTKALQERLFIQANIRCRGTRFICVRYGNVLASRGSVIPCFHDQIRSGGPVTITAAEATRFLLSLNEAVDMIFAAVQGGLAGETYIPRVPSARIAHIAEALIGDRPVETKIVGIRPGEKVHEILISEEEAARTTDRGAYYAILPILPELHNKKSEMLSLMKEYSSADNVMTLEETTRLLHAQKLMPEDSPNKSVELLR